MGSQRCPKCKEGFLHSKRKGVKRCNICGYTVYSSPTKTGRGKILFPKKVSKKEESGNEIPRIQIERKKQRRVDLTLTDPTAKFERDKAIRESRKKTSIQKILKKLRQDKYNTLKEIRIGGELWDVQTGLPVKELKKKDKESEEKKREDFEPDRIIEEMVFKET